MGKRQKAWARKARAALIALHGGKCKRCGAAENLELDCIEPRGHTHHRMDTSAKVCFYRFQHAAGNLQLLCEDCHTIKTAADTLAAMPTDTSPSVEEQPY